MVFVCLFVVIQKPVHGLLMFVSLFSFSLLTLVIPSVRILMKVTSTWINGELAYMYVVVHLWSLHDHE